MKQLTDILASLFGKVAEFFDIFDLSFFVSGALSLAALGFLMYCGDPGHRGLNLLLGSFNSVIGLVGLALGCYVTGLACFATGRQVRLLFVRKTHDEQHFTEGLLKAHGLHELKPTQSYLEHGKHLSQLYVRYWAEVRQSRLAEPSFALLRRYWVLAATYDGVGISGFIWMIVWLALEIEGSLPVNRWVGGFLLPVFPLVALSCFREAARLGRYQSEELAATVAWLHEPIQPRPPAAALPGFGVSVQVGPSGLPGPSASHSLAAHGSTAPAPHALEAPALPASPEVPALPAHGTPAGPEKSGT